MKKNNHYINYQFVINLEFIPKNTYVELEFDLIPIISIDDAEVFTTKINEKLSSIFLNSKWNLLSSKIIINDKNEKFLKLLFSSLMPFNISQNNFLYILDVKLTKNFSIILKDFYNVVLRDEIIDNTQSIRVKTLSNISVECNEYSKITGNNWIVSKVIFEPIPDAVYIIDGVNIIVNYHDTFKNSHKYIKINRISYLVSVYLQIN